MKNVTAFLTKLIVVGVFVFVFTSCLKPATSVQKEPIADGQTENRAEISPVDISKRDYKNLYNEQLIKLKRIDVKTGIGYSFIYNICSDTSLELKLLFSVNDENVIEKISVSGTTEEFEENIYDFEFDKTNHIFDENVEIQQYSYNILTLRCGNFEKWINAFEYMSDSEIKAAKASVKNSEDIVQNADKMFLSLANEEYDFSPEIITRFKELLSDVSVSEAYINENGKPSWAVYATIYALDRDKISEIRLCTDGVIINGIFYNNDNELLNECIKKISGKENLY